MVIVPTAYTREYETERENFGIGRRWKYIFGFIDCLTRKIYTRLGLIKDDLYRDDWKAAYQVYKGFVWWRCYSGYLNYRWRWFVCAPHWLIFIRISHGMADRFRCIRFAGRIEFISFTQASRRKWIKMSETSWLISAYRLIRYPFNMADPDRVFVYCVARNNFFNGYKIPTKSHYVTNWWILGFIYIFFFRLCFRKK